MKAIVTCIASFAFLVPTVSVAQIQLDGPYLGQTPPGQTPEVFAPGIVSMDGTREHALSWSPDGDELFFTSGSGWPESRIMHMKKTGDVWSEPQVASFLVDDWATQATFSPDGQNLYFSSSRGKSDIRHYSLWRCRKTENGWSEPENVIDMRGGPFMEYHPTVVDDGSVIFLLWDFAQQTGDLYISHQLNGEHAEPVIIGPPVSGSYSDVRPTVDPHGRYLLFESNRPGGHGETDIYITLKDQDGSWTTPQNLGPSVNTPENDYTPTISPDGKYWFFGKDGDVYWRQVPEIVLSLTSN